MKKEFSGYYAPTENEYQRLWQEGIIALDANVLLNLYRLPASARDELLAVLTSLKDRLWIPYQVALEYQRRRLTVIASERNSTEQALSKAHELFQNISEQIISLQIDKRGLGLKPEPLIEDLKIANDKLITAITSVQSSQLDITMSDSVRDKLDVLFSGRVGEEPKNQEELDILISDGQSRYDCSIPPGFSDAGKEKNPKEAVFYHDGLNYQRKFGDLILWRQLIAHAKNTEKKVVLFITSDRKEDWWWREHGKTIGPRPELIREIQKEANVEIFWMYSSVQFLENAKQFIKANVSDESLSELKEVNNSRDRNNYYSFWVNKISDGKNSKISSRNFIEYLSSIEEWLSRRYGDVQVSRSFPKFVVPGEIGPHGYDVKIIPSISPVLFPPGIINAILRGYMEVKEGRLARFTVIILLKINNIDVDFTVDQANSINDSIKNLIKKYPLYEIIIGYVDENSGLFHPLINQKGNDPYDEDY
ncbi:PIN-like domain-containing protein [Gluconobacter japonicus]|uniref:PIN-like domain-containing protein n=1 Tax=Gluconobacter japonicus TaxID=376620 RepID=UPI003D28D29A